MAEAESGEGWPRLMAWLREKRDEAQRLVMTGQLSREDYLGMSMRYAAFVETLDQAKVISRGEDVKPTASPTAIQEQIEGP